MKTYKITRTGPGLCAFIAAFFVANATIITGAAIFCCFWADGSQFGAGIRH